MLAHGSPPCTACDSLSLSPREVIVLLCMSFPAFQRENCALPGAGVLLDCVLLRPFLCSVNNVGSEQLQFKIIKYEIISSLCLLFNSKKCMKRGLSVSARYVEMNCEHGQTRFHFAMNIHSILSHCCCHLDTLCYETLDPQQYQNRGMRTKNEGARKRPTTQVR